MNILLETDVAMLFVMTILIMMVHGPYNGLLGNQIKDVIFGQSWDKTNVSANDKLIKEASLSDQAALSSAL